MEKSTVRELLLGAFFPSFSVPSILLNFFLVTTFLRDDLASIQITLDTLPKSTTVREREKKSENSKRNW